MRVGGKEAAGGGCIHGIYTRYGKSRLPFKYAKIVSAQEIPFRHMDQSASPMHGTFLTVITATKQLSLRSLLGAELGEMGIAHLTIEPEGDKRLTVCTKSTYSFELHQQDLVHTIQCM